MLFIYLQQEPWAVQNTGQRQRRLEHAQTNNEQHENVLRAVRAADWKEEGEGGEGGGGGGGRKMNKTGTTAWRFSSALVRRPFRFDGGKRRGKVWFCFRVARA